MNKQELASKRAEYHDEWLNNPKLAALTNQCLAETEVRVGRHTYPHVEPARVPRAACYAVLNESSVTAAFSVQGRTGILNFASAHKPGGGYLNGARAQEEALCHSSNLYEVLSAPICDPFYSAKKPSGVYTSDYIYSPTVFNRDADGTPVKPRKFDVMTIAAPNLNARAQYDAYAPSSKDAVQKALDERIGLTISEFIRHDCVNVILGAFGCGVFGNDPNNAARIFKEWLQTKRAETYFDNIVFAVYDTTAEKQNYNAFKRVFG